MLVDKAWAYKHLGLFSDLYWDLLLDLPWNLDLLSSFLVGWVLHNTENIEGSRRITI